MTVTRSAISITSMSLWVMKTMAFPSSAMRRMTPKRSRTSRGVRTAVGSSMMRISAPRQRALTISTRCCSPTESCQTRASGWTGRPRSRAKAPMDSSSERGRITKRGSLMPRVMFSATVKPGTSLKRWWTIPMPSAIACPGERISAARLRIRISPASGRYSPPRMFMRVVFPAPFSPSRAWTSPARSSRDAPSLATTPGKAFVIPRI